MPLNTFNLALFLTRGVSLTEWDKIGTLQREIKPYQKLAESFKSIYIFTYGGVQDQKYKNLFPDNVYIVNKPILIPSLVYSFILPFVHYKKFKDIQISKTNQMDGSWSAVIAKLFFGSKLVIRCGYEWLQTIEKSGGSKLKKVIAYLVEKFAYMNADQIILTSEDIKAFVMNRFNIDSAKINLIPNFVDTDLFRPMNLEKKDRRIIFVGRLEEEKNLHSLILSLVGLEAELVIIGEGSLRTELEELAQREKVKVEFKGNVPQALLPAELNKSEVFVLPSLYEGNPKVLIEAMACSLACVGTDVSGIRELITDNLNGVLVQTNPESLRMGITELLKDPSRRIKLGEQARQKILSQNSFPIFIERELAVYNKTQLKIGTFGMINNPIYRQEPWRENISNRLEFFDVVCLVCGYQGDVAMLNEAFPNEMASGRLQVAYKEWPFPEWRYDEFAKHLNTALNLVKEQGCDWGVKLDIDTVFHEEDQKKFRDLLDKADRKDKWLVSFSKKQFFRPTRYWQKSHLPIALNLKKNMAYGFDETRYTDLCQPIEWNGISKVVYNGQSYDIPTGKSVPENKVLKSLRVKLFNYDFTFRTYDRSVELLYQIEMAHARFWGKGYSGLTLADITRETSMKDFIDTSRVRYGYMRKSMDIEEHPKAFQKSLKDLDSTQWGTELWGKIKI